MNKVEGYDAIKKIIGRTHKKLKAIKQNCDRDNPIDMDLMKTEKAMVYELIKEVINKVNRSESEDE
jgi:hypothetical protein